MDTWFPLSKSMMEDCTEFTKLSPSEKVFWLSILSEVNLRGEFYKADLEWAVTLALSLSKVRQARRKYQSLGWLETTPGRRIGTRRLATNYHSAKWARPEKDTLFVQLHRYAWDSLTRYLRVKEFNHRDLVVYAYLCYFWQKFDGENQWDILNGEDPGIFVPKRHFRVATNLSGVNESLRRLHSNFHFSSGDSLFKYFEGYHCFQFRTLAKFADPDEDEDNAVAQVITERTLRQAICNERARQYNIVMPENSNR